MRRRRPDGLGVAGSRLWGSVSRDYDLSAAEVELLTQACRTADLLAAIDHELTGGVVAEGYNGQPRAHPLLQQAVEHRKLLNTLLLSLALPEPGEDFGRVRSPQQRAAAQARWRERGVGV